MKVSKSLTTSRCRGPRERPRRSLRTFMPCTGNAEYHHSFTVCRSKIATHGTEEPEKKDTRPHPLDKGGMSAGQGSDTGRASLFPLERTPAAAGHHGARNSICDILAAAAGERSLQPQ